MLTPSADDHPPQRGPDIDDTIPTELEQLDQRLLSLGATWRHHPAVTRLASYAQKLPSDLTALDNLDSAEIIPDLAAREASAQGTASVEKTTMNWHNTGSHRVSSRKVQAVLASVAAVLIVGLLAATFAVFSHQSASRAGAPATATTPATSSWTDLARLSSTTTFALAAPAIAPSDPRVVYKVTDSPHLALQRTDNGGATWQTYSLPVTNALNFMQVYVSPLNPNVLVLHTDGWASQQSSLCNFQAQSWIRTTTGKVGTTPLAALSSQVPAGPFLPCSQFESTNGGRSWTPSPVFFDSARILTAGGESAGIFMVQGNRLYTYEGFTCQSATGVCGGGLLVSRDKGITWVPAPTPSPGPFCGVGMAPTGTLMFAITSSQCGKDNVPSENTIWRSDDAGEHWAPVSHLQFSAVDGLRVVLNPATGAPTVFITTSNLANVNTPDITRTTTVQMSQDGGKTWSALPTAGIPTGWSAIDVVAQTSDGSAIALFVHSGNLATELYSLLPGGSSWLPVAPTPSPSQAMYLVTSSPSGTDSLWAVSVSLGTVGGVNLTNDVYRLQL